MTTDLVRRRQPTDLARPREVLPATPADALNAYKSTVSPSSHRPILESLRYVARLLEAPDDMPLEKIAWHLVTYRDFSEIVRRLKLAETRRSSPNVKDPNGRPLLDPIAPSTANRHIGALRRLMRQCFLLGMMPNPAEWSLIKEIETLKVSNEQRGREVAAKDLTSLLDACDPHTLRGARDAAILALLFTCGLRRFEAAGARQSKYDADSGDLTIRGKGNKTRVVFLADEAKGAVDQWLAKRGPVTIDRILVRLTPQGELTKTHKQIGGAALLHAARRLAKLAGVRSFGCHDLRRTFATQMYRKKVPGNVIQRSMGHSKQDTTGRYNMMGLEEQRAAVSVLEGFKRSKP